MFKGGYHCPSQRNKVVWGVFFSVVKIMDQIHFCAENFAQIQLNLKDKIIQMSVLCSSTCTFVNAKSWMICNHQAQKELCCLIFSVSQLRRCEQVKNFDSKQPLLFQIYLCAPLNSCYIEQGQYIFFAFLGTLLGVLTPPKTCIADISNYGCETGEIQCEQQKVWMFPWNIWVLQIFISGIPWQNQ